jgi:hypothetical protein
MSRVRDWRDSASVRQTNLRASKSLGVEENAGTAGISERTNIARSLLAERAYMSSYVTSRQPLKSRGRTSGVDWSQGHVTGAAVDCIAASAPGLKVQPGTASGKMPLLKTLCIRKPRWIDAGTLAPTERLLIG